MDGWMNGGVEEEMGAQGLEGWGKGSLMTLPPSVVSFSCGTELAVLHWVLLHRPHTTSTQQTWLCRSNKAFQQQFTLMVYITHTHCEPRTEPGFKQAPVSQLDSIKNIKGRERGILFLYNLGLIFIILTILPISNNNHVLTILISEF